TSPHELDGQGCRFDLQPTLPPTYFKRHTRYDPGLLEDFCGQYQSSSRINSSLHGSSPYALAAVPPSSVLQAQSVYACLHPCFSTSIMPVHQQVKRLSVYHCFLARQKPQGNQTITPYSS